MAVRQVQLSEWGPICRTKWKCLWLVDGRIVQIETTDDEEMELESSRRVQKQWNCGVNWIQLVFKFAR